MSLKRIIAIDPGDQTGYAIGTIGDGTLSLDDFGSTDWKTFVTNFDRVMLGDRPFDIVVYETWRLRSTATKAKTGSTFPEIQCIGAFKVGAWRTGAKLVSQEPSHKPVVDAWMGGDAYLPGRGGVEHHRDAIRHLFYYAIHNEEITIDYAKRISGVQSET